MLLPLCLALHRHPCPTCPAVHVCLAMRKVLCLAVTLLTAQHCLHLQMRLGTTCVCGPGGHQNPCITVRMSLQAFEELEALGNDCSRQLNRLRARLQDADKAKLDALTTALGPAFKIEVCRSAQPQPAASDRSVQLQAILIIALSTAKHLEGCCQCLCLPPAA